MQLLIPLWIWGSLFPIPELPLLIPLPLQDSDGGVIPAAEVHEFLTKIHDVLDNAISKWGWEYSLYCSLPF